MNTSDGLILILLGLAIGLAFVLLWMYAHQQRSGASRRAPTIPEPTSSPALASSQPMSSSQSAPEASTRALDPAPQRLQPEQAMNPPPEPPIAGRPLARRAGAHRGSLWISHALPPELERARLERELRALIERRRKARRRLLYVGGGVLGLLALALLIPSARSALKPYATWLGIRLGFLPPPPPPELAPPPRDLEVSYSNQVEEKGGRLTFRGTVRNISTSETFENLYAELSLIKRESRLIETRVVPVRPSRLRPGDVGTYELTVSASEFMGNRRVRLLADGGEIPYRYVPPEAPRSQ